MKSTNNTVPEKKISFLMATAVKQPSCSKFGIMRGQSLQVPPEKEYKTLNMQMPNMFVFTNKTINERYR